MGSSVVNESAVRAERINLRLFQSVPMFSDASGDAPAGLSDVRLSAGERYLVQRGLFAAGHELLLVRCRALPGVLCRSLGFLVAVTRPSGHLAHLERLAWSLLCLINKAAGGARRR